VCIGSALSLRPAFWYTGRMCRSIKTLRPPYTEHPTSEDSHAAALQYVRKISGMRKPAKVNENAFEAAVAEIAHITDHLLEQLVIRGGSIAS